MFKDDVEALVSHLENLISTKTIIGEPITAGDVTVIPVVTATMGFGVGSGEGGGGKDGTQGGGAAGGAGATVTPTAMVVIHEGEVKVFNIGHKGSMEKLSELVPELVKKISGKFGGGSEDKPVKTEA